MRHQQPISLDAAQALHNARRFAEAEQMYAQLLQAHPADPDLWALFGTIAVEMGRHDQGVERLTRAIRLDAKSAAYHFNLGLAYQGLGKLVEAGAAFDKAIAVKRDYAEAFLNRGLIEYALKRYPEAIKSFTRAVTLKNRMAVAYMNRGVVYQAMGDYEAALRDVDRAIALQPDYAEAHSNRGAVLQQLKRYEEALVSHDKAVALAPSVAAVYSNRAATLVHLERADEARRDAEKAIALAPNYAEAYLNCGNSLLKLGDLEGFVANCRRAAVLNPDYADAHRNASLGLLMLGRYAEAWPGYEWRWQCPDLGFVPRPFAQPRWNGQADLDGALLIWGEQGIGDEILYAGMVGELAARGMKVMSEVDGRLVLLMARSFPNVRMIACQTPPDAAALSPEVAAQIPAGSLGQYLRRDRADFPVARTAYLNADKERTARFRAQLMGDAPGMERLVGISWISKNASIGVHKTMPLAALAPVFKSAGTRFVDLQYGDTAAERADVEQATGVRIHHLDELDIFDDLDGLAALISACDLVITVSNTTAHLAGALGVPTWVLVPSGNGQLWYWGHADDATPWYPAVKLYRQAAPGRSEDSIARMAADLPHLAGERIAR